MKIKKPKFKVQVLNSEKLPISNAEVVLTSRKKEYVLNCENKKGYYTSEKKIPKGVYLLTISKKPFEEEKRKVRVDGSDQLELFILLKKGTPFYYRGKVKVPFSPDENRIALKIPEKTARGSQGKQKVYLISANRKSIAQNLAKEHQLEMEEQPESFIDSGIFICKFPTKSSKEERMKICANIEKEESNTALPIVNISDDQVTLLTNEIMIKFEDHVSEAEVKKMAGNYKLKVKRKISVLGNFYHLTTGDIPTYHIFDLINELAELNEVVFAEPSFESTIIEDAITPTDFLFPEQWDHQIINTPDAWQFLRNINVNRTFGSSEVIIGIVDSGVDPNHPDFNGTVSDGSSKIYQAFDFANMVANNNTLTSGHGTSCASAAASSSNNLSGVAGTNEGVAGVAGNARIIAMRRSGNEAKYADMYLWAGGLDPESDIDDSPAQITPGADVISSSIALSSSVGNPISGTMAAVFDALTDEGRGGKGTLLFFSAANAANDNDITFDRPWGMYPKCFSIAASTLANDGVTEIQASYSNFSSVTEFCAPSHDAYISSSPLHNPNGNYGTFTATPTSAPEGHGTVGRPTVQTTLTVNANAGTNSISVNSVAGMATGQAIMLNNPGSGNTESHIINAINNGTNQVTLNRNLFNSHPNGTTVFAAARDYRNNFGGTSHATPLCAGTAALMLSANPELTWTQVRDLMRNTAVKINPGETNSNGRWQDINGNFSNDPAYDSNPVFSEFYGFGRIDAAAAVREAGWDIELVTTNLNFNDIPEGEQAARAVRFNVKSLWSADFNMTAPGAPFDTPLGTSESIGTSTDANLVREVYLWVTYTGKNDGDTISPEDGFSVTVINPQTEQEWIIPITANTIARPTAALMLSLDQSGSMTAPSGIGNSKRIDVLRFSANILADVIQEGNGLGIVSFDQSPHDVLSLVGPLGPVTPFDADRTSIKSAISGFTPNINGMTAIGDGIERAQLRLNPISGYDSKSVVVFTDGHETAPKYIADVADQINDRVFAIGLGKAENIKPAALNSIVNSNGGYLLLTDDLDENSVFKLAKYFLQILAGVNNEDVVVDPDGTLFPGQEHRIPFNLNEADITSDIILMLPSPRFIDFHLETPNGQILTPADSASMQGLEHSYGNNVAFYRLTLPLPIGAGEREGKWEAVLKINEKFTQHSSYHSAPTHLNRDRSSSILSQGVPYSLLIHAYSNLKMNTYLTQDHYEPGANIQVKVQLTQYEIPLNKPASVTAEMVDPTGQQKTISFVKTGDGEYVTKVKTDSSGVYRFRVMVNGTTLRGRKFTREQVRTGAVWAGGNRPNPESGNRNEGDKGREEFCKLISCLLSEKNLSKEMRKRLLKKGINVDGIIDCLKKYCKERSATHLSANLLANLKVQYSTLIKAYDDILEED
ncbi:MAG: S8 family serine peptidase [Saprospiraceae bacterium]